MISRFCLKAVVLLLIAVLPVGALEAPSEPLLVAAAADLAPLEVQLTQGFAVVHGGPVRFVFGASGMLARQIENGASYDVYLSANEQFVQQLAASGRLHKDTQACYATGRLGIWSARTHIKEIEEITKPSYRLIAIPNPAHAPYGAAAVAMLRRLGLWEKVEPKAVYAENVREALEFATTGNAEAVLTAWTLLIRKPGAILLPDSSHPPILQFGGVVKGSANETRARAFMHFLLSPAGQEILRRGGLYPPPATR